MKKLIVILSAFTLVAALCFSGASAQETPTPTIQVDTGLVADIIEPSGRLSGLVIGIDAGHQAHGNNEQEPIAPGSTTTKPKVSSGTSGVNSRTPEHEINLAVSLLLKDALEKQGARVVMSREAADVDISNVERAVMMNEENADLVLRIHCNGAESASPKGLALYVRKTGTRADECADSASVLLESMIDATGAQNRGIVLSDDYTGLNWSEVPSILVEMGFLTNPQEDALLGSAEYQDKLVSGMVEGIAAYFER